MPRGGGPSPANILHILLMSLGCRVTLRTSIEATGGRVLEPSGRRKESIFYSTSYHYCYRFDTLISIFIHSLFIDPKPRV